MPEVPYFKCYRSEMAKDLLAASNSAFLLLLQIAWRARRTDSFNQHDLDIGEALVGDFKNIGLTEGQYREAKKFLAKHHFATFKATNKGTKAKLINFDVFDPNLEDSNGQHNTPATNQRRTNNEPTTTNKNDKNVNNDKNEKDHSRNEGLSPNVRFIDLTNAIKKKKQELEDYKRIHWTRLAGAEDHWDPGTQKEYFKRKKEAEKMEAEQEELRQSGTSSLPPPPGLRFSEHLLTHGNPGAARLLLIHRNFLEW